MKIKNMVGELTAVYNIHNRYERTKICNSKTSYEALKNTFENGVDTVEEFKILLLDRNNTVLGHSTISKGGYCSTVVDGKVVFSTALLGKASAIILCHNHPSGNINPSDSDIQLTKKLIPFGKMIECEILDHIIIGGNEYYSFADNGLI